MDRGSSLHIGLQPYSCQGCTERLSLFCGNGRKLLSILSLCGWFLSEKLCAHLDRVYHCVAFSRIFVLVCKRKRSFRIPSFVRHNRNAYQHCLFVWCILCGYPLPAPCPDAGTGRTYFTQTAKRDRRYDRYRHCVCSGY